MKEFELDHIGIATESLEVGKQFYEALGLNMGRIETVESEKVKVGFVNLGNQCNIELLEPTNVDSPIGKFIEKRGIGIHHICLRVKDIRQVIQRLKAHGVQMINSEPRLGAHNCEIAFIHPKSTGGVLVELSQPLKTGAQRA